MDKSYNYDLNFIVHSEADAYKIISSLTDDQLIYLLIVCFVDNHPFDVYYSESSKLVQSDCYPYRYRNNDIRQDFKDAVFSTYHENFL